MESPGDTVLYRSHLNPKINRNFEVSSPTDFLAAVTQHIPDKGDPGVSPPQPLKLPCKHWRDLVLRVWHVDPLRCPVCQNSMRVMAIIDDSRVAEKILRHLGAWHDAPARPPPQDLPSYTYQPCDDVDPTPDYENVLTD